MLLLPFLEIGLICASRQAFVISATRECQAEDNTEKFGKDTSTVLDDERVNAVHSGRFPWIEVINVFTNLGWLVYHNLRCTRLEMVRERRAMKTLPKWALRRLTILHPSVWKTPSLSLRHLIVYVHCFWLFV